VLTSNNVPLWMELVGGGRVKIPRRKNWDGKQDSADEKTRGRKKAPLKSRHTGGGHRDSRKSILGVGGGEAYLCGS